MKFFSSLLLLAQCISLASASSYYCQADSCAKAISGGNKSQQSARKSACSSFFRHTVYPKTSTIHKTKTIKRFTTTKTSTTKVITRTTTIFPFTTTTTQTTATQIITKVASTETVTASTTTLLTTSTSLSFLSLPNTRTITIKKKRATYGYGAPAAPTKVPVYAGSCSGVAKYSSACSCVGVRKTTVSR